MEQCNKAIDEAAFTMLRSAASNVINAWKIANKQKAGPSTQVLKLKIEELQEALNPKEKA